MPLSMITNYSEITLIELGVLERQFEKSPFAQQQHQKNARPRKLAIFDFDSTLFFSPFLSPTIWHPNLIKAATAESLYGPWWRNIHSLNLGPLDQLQKTAWQGFWNEKVVKEARHCIQDPDTMTIVLTGRRYHPFHQIIPSMLESKGLHFDLVGLRPDPESVSDNNVIDSVFKSTMHFKTCFILNILHNVPSLKIVVMWDDRFHHVKRFREYLGLVKQTNVIDQGSVIYVPGIRPKYNPAWEKNVISHIIQTHNMTLVEHVKEDKKNGKMNPRLEWPIVRPEDPLTSGSRRHVLQVIPLPAQTIIQLSQDCINQLRQAYDSIYQAQLQKNRRSKWRLCGGEDPLFFGDAVYLSQAVIPSASIPLGPIGTDVKINITAHSRSPKIPCLLLLVEVEGDWENEVILLPLWYKPSDFNDIFRLRDIEWEMIRPLNRRLITQVSGKINYTYRLGVQETTLNTKRPSSNNDGIDEDDVTPPPTSRARISN